MGRPCDFAPIALHLCHRFGGHIHGHAEIRQLDISVLCGENICRLKVTVDYVRVMEIGETLENLGSV
jgi:hypothetical protein